MSDAWIAMPLSSLAFALQLANVESKPSSMAGADYVQPARPFTEEELETLTVEVSRQLRVVARGELTAWHAAA